MSEDEYPDECAICGKYVEKVGDYTTAVKGGIKYSIHVQCENAWRIRWPERYPNEKTN